jgi:hypothetical protein
LNDTLASEEEKPTAFPSRLAYGLGSVRSLTGNSITSLPLVSGIVNCGNYVFPRPKKRPPGSRGRGNARYRKQGGCYWARESGTTRTRQPNVMLSHLGLLCQGRLAARQPKLGGGPHQIGYALSAEFSHDVAAVDFDRALRTKEDACNLPVPPPVQQEAQDTGLHRRQPPTCTASDVCRSFPSRTH